ncbi:MAG: succinylglutamate desuccinylase/aspartoacylase family protein [Lachnospiraceae bacterium]|nr:succinylglutamate desuccinylase/aspartoacylase family protein [Lachnospiraceae bacterium]
MIENVVSAALPVNENLRIPRNRLEPVDLNDNRGRISIVTGAHGDELEGQFVCYEVIRRINRNKEALKGTIDIYPVLNPLGMDSGVRTVPKIDMDLNRMFPGSQDGTMMDKVTAGIVESLLGSDICIDVHASDTFVKEIPQARISDEFEQMMVPYAKYLNVDLIWINATATVHESTLAYSLCKLGVPALVMEMGLGNRINQEYGLQVVDGIFHLMKKLGLWEGDDISVKEPMVITNDDIEFIRAAESGIFISCAENNTFVKQGDKIGEIIDPLAGEVIYEVKAGCEGLLFTMREHPLAYEGALLARIIRGKEAAE